MRKVSPHTHITKKRCHQESRQTLKGIEILREKLELIIDPLDPEQHQEDLVNVVTGKVVCHSSVNVNNTIMMGKNKWRHLNRVDQRVSMILFPEKSVRRKSMKVGDAKVFDTEIMFARAMALQAGSHRLNINDINDINEFCTALHILVLHMHRNFHVDSVDSF